MKNYGHKFFFKFLILLTSKFVLIDLAQGTVAVPNLKDSGEMTRDHNGYIDPQVNYENFFGRVTDKDDSNRVFKVKVENNNIKFFRAGDVVKDKINLMEKKNFCTGHVRSVEDFHFSMYVDGLSPCYSTTEYFRRGTVLKFQSKVLATRVFEASKFREQLILRKEDFLQQLSDVNQFIWNYEQLKVKMAATYDEKIAEIEREKQKALDEMISKKHENLVLQLELSKKLDELDHTLKFYRVERQEYLTDRWNMGHDLGLPLSQRPQKIRKP